MNWKWWKKDRRGEWNPREEGVFPGRPEIPVPHTFDVPQQFIVPEWLDAILKRVMARFDPADIPDGWNMQAYQTRGEYYVVLTGPVISVERTPFGDKPIQMRHELVFEKSLIKLSSEEVAEWTIYKALEEIFGLIGNNPFPPELEEMM